MKNKIKIIEKWRSSKLLYFLLSIIAFCSCSQDEEITLVGDSVLVSFSGGLRSTFDRENLWFTSDTIGIYMKKNGVELTTAGAIVDAGINKKYVADDNDAFNPVSGNEMFYPLDGSSVNLVAYYPYTHNITSDYEVPVNTEDQSSPRKIDILVARGTTAYSKTNTMTNLTLDHALSKLNIRMTAGIGFIESDLSSITASLEGYPSTAVVSLAQNRIHTLANFKNISLRKIGKDYEGILIPYTPLFPQIITVVFTTLSGDKYYWYPSEFIAGNNYSYNVTINKTGITVQSISVLPWLQGYTFVGEA